jgi:PTH2 family peptidyl-tRNA hydrolase
MNNEYKMVIVAREDLKLSPGKLAVQVAHAAVKCAFETKVTNLEWFNKWKNEGSKKVVAKVVSDEIFNQLKKQADAFNIVSCIICDAGLTEIKAGTKTVIGFGPGPNNIIDQITGKLPLY